MAVLMTKQKKQDFGDMLCGTDSAENCLRLIDTIIREFKLDRELFSIHWCRLTTGEHAPEIHIDRNKISDVTFAAMVSFICGNPEGIEVY